MAKDVRMRPGNKGLTVKINLWPVEKDYDAQTARLWIAGMATNAATKEEDFFNDPGELLTILGEWNRTAMLNRRCYAKATFTAPTIGDRHWCR